MLLNIKINVKKMKIFNQQSIQKKNLFIIVRIKISKLIKRITVRKNLNHQIKIFFILKTYALKRVFIIELIKKIKVTINNLFF